MKTLKHPYLLQHSRSSYKLRGELQRGGSHPAELSGKRAQAQRCALGGGGYPAVPARIASSTDCTNDSLPAKLGEFLTSSTRTKSPKDSLLHLAPRTLVGKDGHYGHPELKVFAVRFTKGSCKSECWVQLGYTTRDGLRTWHFR